MIPLPTLATLEEQCLAYYRGRFPGRDLSTEGFLGKLSRASAMALWGLHQSVLSAEHDAVPSSDSSTEALDKWAQAIGVPKTSAAGSYGRKDATAGGGGTANLTGTLGTSFSAATTATTADGLVSVSLRDLVVIAGTPPGAGSVVGTFDGVTTGKASNLPAGTVLSWDSPPAGADPSFTLSTALVDGLDAESNAELLARILTRLREPPKGSVASDFRAWAESVQDIYRAYPYPLRSGLGTCDLVVTAKGTGLARDPGATLKTAVDDYINGSATQEGKRLVTTEGYETLRPYQPAARALTVRSRLVPSSSKHNFDWDDTGGALYIASGGYAAGPPATITLSAAAPATLQAAVAAGTKPRIQVLQDPSVGASPVPVQVRVTAIDVSTPSAPILTLENPLPTGWLAPIADGSERVYAGGSMATIIAQAQLDYVDSLGPSRLSGYAPPLDAWEDTVAIARLTQIALDAGDTDGQRYAKNIVATGVTIAVGAGAAAATDVQAQDNTTNGPELLYAVHVVVTQ